MPRVDKSTRPSSASYQALLRSARELFAEKGYSEVGIREIAAKADVTIGTLYYYAPSKEQLFLSLLLDSYEKAITRLREAADSVDDPAGKLRALVEAHVTGQVQGREIWTLQAEIASLSDDSTARLKNARDEFEHVWRSVIELGIDTGAFRSKHPGLDRIAIIKICNGVSDWFSADGALTLREICAVTADQALLLLSYRGNEAGRPG